ncbi:MAG: hypothetical protein NZ534_12460 [Bacteroidia bacterium]|nr:hypothetical protein [Bacteroidia bacterium]
MYCTAPTPPTLEAVKVVFVCGQTEADEGLTEADRLHEVVCP